LKEAKQTYYTVNSPISFRIVWNLTEPKLSFHEMTHSRNHSSAAFVGRLSIVI